jgi:hypothetical protein
MRAQTIDGDVITSASRIDLRGAFSNRLLNPEAPWVTTAKGRGPFVVFPSGSAIVALMMPTNGLDVAGHRKVIDIPFVSGVLDVGRKGISAEEEDPLVAFDALAQLEAPILIARSSYPELRWYHDKNQPSEFHALDLDDIRTSSGGKLLSADLSISQPILNSAAAVSPPPFLDATLGKLEQSADVVQRQKCYTVVWPKFIHL